MANVKISALPNATNLGITNSDESFVVVQDNITKKITLTSLLQNFNRPVTVNSDNSTANNFIANGSTVDNLLFVSATENKVAVGGSDVDPNSIFTIHGDLLINGSLKEKSHAILPVDYNTPIANASIPINITTTALEVVDNSTFNLGPGKKGQWKIIHIGRTHNPSPNVTPKASIAVSNLVTPGIGTSFGPTNIILTGNHASVTLMYDSFYTQFDINDEPIQASLFQGWVVLANNSASITY